VGAELPTEVVDNNKQDVGRRSQATDGGAERNEPQAKKQALDHRQKIALMNFDSVSQR
jgi:hypothetical protein